MAAQAIRLAVLVSGGGTTLANLIERIGDGRLKAQIALVLASSATCRGLERARNARLATRVIEHRRGVDPAAYGDEVFTAIRTSGAELVLLAGFLHLLRVPTDYHDRVLNIHPALLPAFGGKGMYGHHVHEAVLRAGVAESGCTVHIADNEYDHGPIILQRRVPVLDGDTADQLASRVFAAECEAYPAAIALYGAGKVRVRDGRLQIDP